MPGVSGEAGGIAAAQGGLGVEDWWADGDLGLVVEIVCR